MTITSKTLAENLISPWDQGPDAAGQYLLSIKQPVRYEVLLGGKPRIIFLGEAHTNSAIHRELQAQADGLRSAGITTFLIEANSDQGNLFKLLNSGDFSLIYETGLGPLGRQLGPVNREQRVQMVKVLHSEGIEILPIDDPINYEKKELTGRDSLERDKYLARKVQEVAMSREGKIAALVGSLHAIRGSDYSVIDLLERQGIECRSIFFAGGEGKTPEIVTESAKRYGIDREKFAFQVRGVKAPYGINVDYIVHLPQEEGFGV